MAPGVQTLLQTIASSADSLVYLGGNSQFTVKLFVPHPSNQLLAEKGFQLVRPGPGLPSGGVPLYNVPSKENIATGNAIAQGAAHTIEIGIEAAVDTAVATVFFKLLGRSVRFVKGKLGPKIVPEPPPKTGGSGKGGTADPNCKLPGAGNAPNKNPVEIDIWGEGRYENALNLNRTSVTTTTGQAGRPIPRLVEWDGGTLPFADASVDIIHLENAPIRKETISEIARVIRPGGDIRLVGPRDVVETLHAQIAEAVGGMKYQTIVPTSVGDTLYTNIIVPLR